MFTLVVIGAVGDAGRDEGDARRGGRRPLGAPPRRADHPRSCARAGGGAGSAPVSRHCGCRQPPRRRLGHSGRVDIGAGDSILFATAIVAAAAMFMAIGLSRTALPTRHDANVLGAASSPAPTSCGWRQTPIRRSRLRWLSPLGWIEETDAADRPGRAPAAPRRRPRCPARGRRLRVARERDLGASAFPSRDAPRPRLRLLGGQAGLTVRLTRTPVASGCWRSDRDGDRLRPRRTGGWQTRSRARPGSSTRSSVSAGRARAPSPTSASSS